MEYKFELPKELKIDSSMAMLIHGGFCPSEDVIYLYRWLSIPYSQQGIQFQVEGSEYLWEQILEHEHLHAILHKFGISVKYHEQMIRAMKDICAVNRH